MPPPLPPHHYPEPKSRRRPIITPGTWVNLLHSLYYLVPFVVLVAIGWWVYTLQNYPLKLDLPIKYGPKIHAMVEGRDDNLVKYVDLSTGQTSYVTIDSLTRWGRLVAWLMPVNMRFSFPIECVLTDKNGKNIRVRIEGHSASLVKFTLMSNGVSYLYPLANLSEDNQAWIMKLPAAQDEILDAPDTVQKADPVFVQQLEERLARVQQEMREAKAHAAEPVYSGTQRDVYLKEIQKDQDEIVYLETELDAALRKGGGIVNRAVTAGVPGTVAQ